MTGVEHRARLEQIYRDHAGLILAYAARRTASAEDAADVLAETFATAWRRIDDVPPGEQARPWLYGVARRVCANQRRSRDRRARLDERMARELHAAVASALAASLAPPDDGPDAERVAAAFAGLPPADRELLGLVGWEGLGRDEIAVVLGCSRAAVRVRLHRARQRFAKALAAAGVPRPRVQRPPAAGHDSGTAAPFRAPASPDPEVAR